LRRPPIIARSRCIIVGDEGILVQKDKDGIYGLPGGRLEFEETLPLCAVRELREEAGLEVFPERIVYIVEFLGRKKGKLKHELLYIFKCVYKGEVIEKSKSISFEWRRPEELKGSFWPGGLLSFIINDYPEFDSARFIVLVNESVRYMNTLMEPTRHGKENAGSPGT